MTPTLTFRNVQIMTEVEQALTGLEVLMGAEKLLVGDIPAMIGGTIHNLELARRAATEGETMQALLRATYCLGKLHSIMDVWAGDHEGTRCKRPELRGELRQYREVARELALKLGSMFA